MIYRCRCRVKSCGMRRTLKKHPDEYVRPPLCFGCKSVLKLDRYRQEKEHKNNVCKCDGVHWPHRKGSVLLCIHHPVGPSETEYYKIYGIEV